MTYRFRIPAGDGSCICATCDCEALLEVQTVPLAARTRDGWNGWGDDGSCRIWKTLDASATRDGTLTITDTNGQVFEGGVPTGEPCVETITGSLDLAATFTVGEPGDRYQCMSVTGSVTLEVSGTGADGSVCLALTESDPHTPSCDDFTGYPTSSPLSAHPDPLDGLLGVAVGWPRGCYPGVVTADWPYPFWRAQFLFGGTLPLRLENNYDGGGAHFVLTAGGTTASSGEYTMNVSSTTHPASGVTLQIEDNGSVQISLSDEWTVAALLDEVTTAGSDGFTDTSGPAISSLSADTLTATYRAARYRFQRAPQASTVTYVEVTEKWSPDTGGTLVGSTTSPAATLNLPAQAGEDAQYSDWFNIFPPAPEAGFTYVVSPSVISSTCWLP
jgi:hypothetical protein